ncbi:sugar-binding transcriptional regulator [Lacticigenium naphthae]|uniref:sugar-binding transcriptional regulator n=1 Tax=Lacticigenium naphthae TaxID=515351 RepID=UPI000413CBBA|nr:sugar-binding transcriptional regulator [Lacticigenium naphthae]
MTEEKRRMLAKIAYLYYIENKSQNEISKELNIYRTTISRMLKLAKKKGIIEIQIKDYTAELFSLEEYFKEKYQLKDVLIVSASRNNADIFYKEAAFYLKRVIGQKDNVGVSWGATLGEVFGYIQDKRETQATFVPLAGAPSHSKSNFHVNTLVYELARKFKGESIFINASVIQERKELTQAIMNAKYFRELKEYWSKLDIAIMGIGGKLTGTESQWRDLLTTQDLKELKLREAAGDICCRFYDAYGKILKSDLDSRTISISLEHLQRIPTRIGIAKSTAKTRAILPTLQKGFVNVLITDVETALDILRVDQDPFYEKIKEKMEEI